MFGADVLVPPNQRGRLIGRGGCVIQNLTKSTGAKVHVPNRPTNQSRARRPQIDEGALDQTEDNEAQPVYVKAATIASLLHALWRILLIVKIDDNNNDNTNIDNNTPSDTGSNNHEQETTTIACRFRLPNAPPIVGSLTAVEFEPSSCPFLVLENGLSAHCIVTSPDLTIEQICTLVDNERFAHSDWTANCEIVEEEATDSDEVVSVVVFIYGAQAQCPKQLSRSLYRSIQEVINGCD